MRRTTSRGCAPSSASASPLTASTTRSSRPASHSTSFSRSARNPNTTRRLNAAPRSWAIGGPSVKQLRNTVSWRAIAACQVVLRGVSVATYSWRVKSV